MTSSPERAEGPLYALLRGEGVPPSRTDDSPFILFARTVESRCRTPRGVLLPDPKYPGTHWHSSERLAGLYRAAFVTARQATSASASARSMWHAATVVRICTLLAEARALAAHFLDPMYIDEARDVLDRLIYGDAVSLEHACLVALAEAGNVAARVSCAEICEANVASGLPMFAMMAQGLRLVGAGDRFVYPYQPGGGPIALFATARELGQTAVRDAARIQAARGFAPETRAELMDDDRAGIVRIPREAPPPPEPAGVIVFPAAATMENSKGDNAKEVRRFLGDRAGARLPFVPVPEDWGAWERPFVSMAPWLASAVRAVRATQGGRSHWSGGAVCFVGGPGAGKSRMARNIAQASGLPFARVNLDSSSDNSSLAGTPVRYTSGHPSAVERMLAEARSACGVMLIDEIEKAAGSRRNGTGDPHDTLHGLLEAETAKAWRSQYLLCEVDLSNVLWICTANTLDSVPQSLQDRMRIVHVDEPGPEHLGVLAPQVAREACRELGLDERWATLDGEEYSALAEAWQGGSIRRLQRLVTGLLRARDGAPAPRH